MLPILNQFGMIPKTINGHKLSFKEFDNCSLKKAFQEVNVSGGVILMTDWPDFNTFLDVSFQMLP